MNRRPLIIACGALAGDLRAVLGPDSPIEVEYLPASFHNRPERIVPALRTRLAIALADGRRVFVGYADCGTGGALDRLLRELPGVERLPGAHCYEFFAGSERFGALHEAEPGTFYLTDYLARHFDALVWQGLGLDRHPELRDEYFRNYRRVVHLAQRDDETVRRIAAEAAHRLGLDFETRHTGYGPFAAAIEAGSVASECPT